MLKRQKCRQDLNKGYPTGGTCSIDNSNEWHTPNDAQFTKMSCGHMLFADDTGIGYTNHNDVPTKIIPYSITADP